MQRNKRRIRSGMPVLTVLLLTGCVRDGNTDFSERYPAYFKYCFGDDAECRFLEIEDDQEHLYTILYSDKDGTERSRALSVIPYDRETVEEYKNAQTYYDVLLEMNVMEELTEVCREDFISAVLTKHFTGTKTESGLQLGEDAKIDVQLLCDVWSESTIGINKHDEVGAKLCAAHITPVTGWQVCTADWTTAAADPQWYWAVSVSLAAGADAEAYLEPLQAAYAEYRAASEAPQSCTFLLRQTDADGVTHLLWRETVLCGETVEPETGRAERSLWDMLEKRLRAYYKMQRTENG